MYTSHCPYQDICNTTLCGATKQRNCNALCNFALRPGAVITALWRAAIHKAVLRPAIFSTAICKAVLPSSTQIRTECPSASDLKLQNAKPSPTPLSKTNAELWFMPPAWESKFESSSVRWRGRLCIKTSTQPASHAGTFWRTPRRHPA